MDRLEKKRINGKDYYYYSKWGWRNGKCRRLWQRYLGKLENIVSAMDGKPDPEYALVFEHGLAAAFLKEANTMDIAGKVNGLCPKNGSALSVGDYIMIAALNRAIHPKSKKGMWNWFSKTTLLREFSEATGKSLRSQRFWDNMERVSETAAKKIWENIITDCVAREDIDMSRISYDGTNFYTFVDTFNVRCSLAKRGKNKQGRSNLRQISYALFCTQEGVPLYYDVYEGNGNDAKVFPSMLDNFRNFLKRRFGVEKMEAADITLVFDKGNNSKDNFLKLDKSGLSFVGSLKLSQCGDLAEISRSDPQFASLNREGMEDFKAFMVKKRIFGEIRDLVVMFNQRLFNEQWKTLNNDISKATSRLEDLRGRLDDRHQGLIKGGRAPTLSSVEKQAAEIRSRPYLKEIIKVDVRERAKAPELQFELDTAKLDAVADTRLGKKIILAKTKLKDPADIIEAYHGQYVIEHVFKDMKDSGKGNWWPLHHWTDQKIRVHGLYCSIAVLLRALTHRRVRRTGLGISMGRLITELADIKEVVNVFPKRKKRGEGRRQTVLTKLNQVQEKILEALDLKTN
jgi:transposase